MNRISKATSTLLKILTIPARVTVGVIRAVQKEMPEQIEFPYELRKKQEQLILQKRLQQLQVQRENLESEISRI